MRPVHNVNIGALIELKTYDKSDDFGQPKGMTEESYKRLTNDGAGYHSLVNKLHIIKLSNDFPANEVDVKKDPRKRVLNAIDLCEMSGAGMGAQQYDVEDFIYCKNYGMPINRLITLRRFPNPCTDNIYDTMIGSNYIQGEPDIARMVTYMTQDVNKMDDVLSFQYGLRWKEITAEMEPASTIGDQSGFENISKQVMSFIDPVLAGNTLQGKNKLQYDPTHDRNRVYGPVDSINSTQIREVGFDFTKDFDLVFEYELQSWAGRTPEFAMRDILANVLAVTFNNGKFWPGSRYWVGERPSQFLDKFRFMSPDKIDDFFVDGWKSLKTAIASFMKPGSAIETLKKVMTNGLAMGIGKILDTVGRPSIVVMNSLLSAEPTGFWHVTIGNPTNPIMCIGNLVCTGVDFKFNTDTLSNLDFPTSMTVTVKLKPGQSKDKAGIETMFNMGRSRIYHNPKTVKKSSSKGAGRKHRGWYDFTSTDIGRTINDTFDFVGKETVQIVQENYPNNQKIAKEVFKTSKEATKKMADDIAQKAKDYKDNSIFK